MVDSRFRIGYAFSPVRTLVYEDGLTIVRQLRYLVRYLNEVLVADINNDLEYLQKEIDDLRKDLIEQNIELNDELIAAVLNDSPDNQTNTVLNQREQELYLKVSQNYYHDVNSLDYNTVREAIADVAQKKSDGKRVVFIHPDKPIPFGDSNFNYNTEATPNIRLQGVTPAKISVDGSHLENGSRITGGANFWADGLEVSKIGFDNGRDVVQANYPGYDTHVPNRPNGGSWGAFEFGNPNQSFADARRNVVIDDIVALCRDPLTNAHAILLEGIDGLHISTAKAYGALHAMAIKSLNVAANFLEAHASGLNDLILKSDPYSLFGNVDITKAVVGRDIPKVSPWWTPITSNGVHFNLGSSGWSSGLHMGSIEQSNSLVGMLFSGYNGDRFHDISIDAAHLDSYSIPDDTKALKFVGDFFLDNFVLSELVANNWNDGIFTQVTNPIQAAFTKTRFVNLRGTALVGLDRGVLDVQTMNVISAANTTWLTGAARAFIGRYNGFNVTTPSFWGRDTPTLNPGWTTDPGVQPFGVEPFNGGARLTGLIKNVGAANTEIAVLPEYLRPALPQTFPVVMRDNSLGTRVGSLSVGNDGVVLIEPPDLLDFNGTIALNNVIWEW